MNLSITKQPRVINNLWNKMCQKWIGTFTFCSFKSFNITATCQLNIHFYFHLKSIKFLNNKINSLSHKITQAASFRLPQQSSHPELICTFYFPYKIYNFLNKLPPREEKYSLYWLLKALAKTKRRWETHIPHASSC